MNETDDRASQIEYEPAESTTIESPKSTREIEAETNIEEALYGKNKPRRKTVNRKVVYDKEKPMSSE